jgi:hypothetical protein
MSEEEQQLLLENAREWIASMDSVCRSPEVIELIMRLERDHHTYPQLIVNVDEN